jgi:hypothetical protein
VASHPAVEARLLQELASLGLAASPDNPQPAQMKWEHLAQVRALRHLGHNRVKRVS